MKGVAILHETIHELHTKKQVGVIFKIDFEKAYDKVTWSFLQQTLRMKRFSSKWCRWIEEMIKGVVMGSRSMMTYVTRPVQYIVADMLAILIKRVKDDGQIRGVIPHLVDDGLSILQYADDTIFFLDHDIQQAKRMKLLLSVFEHMSGLKINFHKSETFATDKRKSLKRNILNSLDAMLVSIPLDIWGSQCIIDSSLIMIEGKLKNVSKRN